MQISDSIIRLAEQAETALAPHFARIDRIAFANTAKVLDAFREHRVAANNFDSTSGYGYDDKGRDVLDRIWADVMGAEAAFGAPADCHGGTHALTVGLFGLLRPGDVMLSVAGKPYDTLEEVIGITGTPGDGSLRDFGVGYDTVELTPRVALTGRALKQRCGSTRASENGVRPAFQGLPQPQNAVRGGDRRACGVRAGTFAGLLRGRG